MYLSLRISFSLRSVDVDANYLFYLFILNTESENLWDHGIKKINFHLGWGWTREYSLEAGPRDDVQQQSSRLNQDGSSRAASSPVQSISWIALITPRVQSDVGARTCFRWTGLQDFGTPVSRSELPHRTVSLYESWPPSFRELPTLPPSRHPFSFIREGSPLQGCKLQLIGSTLKNQDISLSLSLSASSALFSMSSSSEMDRGTFNTPERPRRQQRLPPKRGQVIINVLKTLFQIKTDKTAAERGGGWPDGGGGFVSSNSATPTETRSGYCSGSWHGSLDSVRPNFFHRFLLSSVDISLLGENRTGLRRWSVRWIILKSWSCGGRASASSWGALGNGST